ncbi:hypothetical protein [Paraburkholderia panacisoli]|uniref:hypothetical protein n=1 Tax=Paraburkholderia panacisoli TaxID=2603818 RepID=UPI001FE9A184|nr:hypothetical protein [Paraburkholderia panacisoli]
MTGDVDFGGAFNGSIVKLVAAHAPVKAVISYVGTDKETNGGLFVLQGSPTFRERPVPANPRPPATVSSWTGW